MVEPASQNDGRSRSGSPADENPRDPLDRSRSPDRRKGSSEAEHQVSVSISGNGPASSSRVKSPLPAREPARITEQLRKVVGEDSESLPVLVGIVCAQLASKQQLDRAALSEQLSPHLPAAAKLEDFFSWLDDECLEVRSDKPADPRIAGQAGQAPALSVEDGDFVLLSGLEKRPDLNGCTAEVLRINDPSQPGRVVLKLENGSQIAIRPQNLQRVERPVSPASGKTGEAREEAPASPQPKKKKKKKIKPECSGQSGLDPSSSKVFGSAFEKLKAKAEAEARGELPADTRKKVLKNDLDNRGGIGSAQPAGQARRELILGSESKPAEESEVAEEPPKREPINFVPAEEKTEMPSRKVTVIDPRKNKRPLEEDSSDEEVETPGVVRPRKAAQDPTSPWSPGVRPFDSPRHKAKDPPEPVCRMPAAPPRGLARTGGAQVPNSPTQASRPHGALPASKRGNMTLVVSEDAREADKAQRDLVEKRKAMEEGRRQMLEKLTKQMQICLARLQNTELDDKAKEKYQDMIASLKTQMSRIGNV